MFSEASVKIIHIVTMFAVLPRRRTHEGQEAAAPGAAAAAERRAGQPVAEGSLTDQSQQILVSLLHFAGAHEGQEAAARGPLELLSSGRDSQQSSLCRTTPSCSGFALQCDLSSLVQGARGAGGGGAGAAAAAERRAGQPAGAVGLRPRAGGANARQVGFGLCRVYRDERFGQDRRLEIRQPCDRSRVQLHDHTCEMGTGLHYCRTVARINRRARSNSLCGCGNDYDWQWDAVLCNVLVCGLGIDK